MMIAHDAELKVLEIARDVLQKQIDERVALRRQEMLPTSVKGNSR